MKTSKIPVMMLIGCLLLGMVLLTACDDERTPPLSPSDTTYSETIILVDTLTTTGQQIDASFTLLDDVKEGFIKVSCFFDPVEYLADYEQYGDEIETLETDNEALNVNIINLGLEVNELPGTINTLGVELTAIETEIIRLEGIDPRSEEQQDSLDAFLVQKDETTALRDSLRIRKEAIKVERETYRIQKVVNIATINKLLAYRDILDVFLDDLYSLSLGQGADSINYYPGAIFLDDSVEVNETYFELDTTIFDPADGSVKANAIMDPAQIDSTWLEQTYYDSLLAVLDDLSPTLDTLKADNDTGQTNWAEMRTDMLDDSLSMVWGQGIFLAPEPDDSTKMRGTSFKFDLEEFWVADSGWTIGRPFIHEARPERGSAYTNQYPVRNYLSEMTEGTHSLHFRFGADNTDTKIIVTLYVVYYEKVGR